MPEEVATGTRRTIDLDAARLARAEKRGEPPIVLLGGVEYALPAELPSEVVVAFGQVVRGDVGALDDALSSLFGDALAEIKAAGLSWEDEKFLLEETLQEYGFELPES